MPVERPLINSDVPHSARIWNYWLGGKDCYEIDRQVGDRIAGANPAILDIAVAQRAFLAPPRARPPTSTPTSATPRPSWSRPPRPWTSLLAPGVVSVTRWRPTSHNNQLPAEVDDFGGVARKP